MHGDGRLAVRSSYAMAYDFMAGEYHNINANAPPFGNRSLLDDPPGRSTIRTEVGGDPHPIVTNANTDYVPFGTFGTMDPDINSPRIQSWNVTVEQQLGTDWGVVGRRISAATRIACGRRWRSTPASTWASAPARINGVCVSRSARPTRT